MYLEPLHLRMLATHKSLLQSMLSFGFSRLNIGFCICTDDRALLQKWEDRIKHAQDNAAHQDELSSDPAHEVPPEEAAFMALKKWASTGRKCRQALKRANPTTVEDLELHYLQFMRQVGVRVHACRRLWCCKES